MRVNPSVEITEDGSPTFRHPVLGDTYHSTRGAEGEAMHVFIENGLRCCRKWGELSVRLDRDGEYMEAEEDGSIGADYADNYEDRVGDIKILEVGFGSGLNAYLTLRETEKMGVCVKYTALELYPVESEAWTLLKYSADPLFTALHQAEWGRETVIRPHFILKKLEIDLVYTTFDTIFDIIYFDAFAPDTQPELWTQQVFETLYRHTAQGGALVTYSSKGDVKRALRGAGYDVKRLNGALGKRHMLRAEK